MAVLSDLSLNNKLESESESVKVQVTQSSLTLCDPMDFTVHGILQARILEWVAFPFSRVLGAGREALCPWQRS